MSRSGFWDDRRHARDVTREASSLSEWIDPWHELDEAVGDLEELDELLGEEEDEELFAELEEGLSAQSRVVSELELRNMLRGPDDHRDAIVTINPGAGGLESQDWAEMLMRTYTRWAERRGYEVEPLDVQSADEGGIKSASLEIAGAGAYGFLRAEAGVHRLVRISPFDAQSRRHTSFASVFVYPEVDDSIRVDIDERDLRIDTYRASGAGGQHVNKTDSAVRITHEPTGIVVACQQERSQHKNKATAMKMLRAALYQHAVQAQEKERAALEAEKTDIGWGSQIRSYVFHPYTMVNDHRTGLKVPDVHGVLDGDLDRLIEAYLKTAGREASRG